jgi:hypothetical protein
MTRVSRSRALNVATRANASRKVPLLIFSSGQRNSGSLFYLVSLQDSTANANEWYTGRKGRPLVGSPSIYDTLLNLNDPLHEDPGRRLESLEDRNDMCTVFFQKSTMR